MRGRHPDDVSDGRERPDLSLGLEARALGVRVDAVRQRVHPRIPNGADDEGSHCLAQYRHDVRARVRVHPPQVPRAVVIVADHDRPDRQARLEAPDRADSDDELRALGLEREGDGSVVDVCGLGVLPVRPRVVALDKNDFGRGVVEEARPEKHAPRRRLDDLRNEDR